MNLQNEFYPRATLGDDGWTCLNVDVGATTHDGKFTILEVECLGYCDLAPVLQVNFDYHEQVTPDRVDEIVANLA